MENDKRILLFHFGDGSTECTDSSPCPPGLHHWFTFAAGTEWEFGSVANVEDIDYSCPFTRSVSGARTFFYLHVYVTLPSQSASQQLNGREFLEQHIQECAAKNNGLVANVVLVDFWSTGDLVGVVQDHNLALVENQQT